MWCFTRTNLRKLKAYNFAISVLKTSKVWETNVFCLAQAWPQLAYGACACGGCSGKRRWPDQHENRGHSVVLLAQTTCNAVVFSKFVSRLFLHESILVLVIYSNYFSWKSTLAQPAAVASCYGHSAVDSFGATKHHCMASQQVWPTTEANILVILTKCSLYSSMLVKILCGRVLNSNRCMLFPEHFRSRRYSSTQSTSFVSFCRLAVWSRFFARLTSLDPFPACHLLQSSRSSSL